VPPTILVAGEGHRELIADLLADAPAGTAVAEQPAAAYVLLRHGKPAGRAYIPGHRRPRDLDESATGDAAEPPTRPPRRVALSRPVHLLEYVHLMIAPDLAPGTAGTDVLVDAVRHSDGLVYVLDAGNPLAPDRREELTALAAPAATGTKVILVDVRDAGEAERAVIVRQVPALARATWHRAADPAALRRELMAASAWLGGAELGAAGAGILGEREGGEAPSPRRLGSDDDTLPAPPGTVRVTDDDVRWRTALHREASAQRSAAHQRLRTELAAVENRCGTDPGALPATLDLELHALSLRTTDALDTAANGLIGAVFAEVVLDRLTEPVRARVVTAVRRHLEPEDRTLLITATAGVAAVSGAAEAVSATGVTAQTIVPPVRVAVSGNCHLMWQYRGVPDKADARRWLHQAAQSLDRELGRAVDDRFAALVEAVEALAAEAVDHGVLLA
jgi:hypothetical protein